MGGRLIISGGGGLRVLEQGNPAFGHIHLPGASAMCACGEELFVSSGCGDMIWRMDRNLMPAALFAGGPGMRQLMVSGDGRQLLALCTDGNSVLMLDGRSGAPQMLVRAGDRPHAMTMRNNTLAVAGGGEGLLLFDAGSLALLSCLRAPWPVVSAALTERYACVLCCDDALNSVLICYERGAERGRMPLPGEPGALLAVGGMLLVCIRGWLYLVSPERMQKTARRRAPGLGTRLLCAGGSLLMLDALGETAFAHVEGSWKRLAHPAEDLCIRRE
ncbi:MAG: hypothetical protein IJD94_09335 [Clostridia bacterium]|nr:hypothetical protein [Clostridia bacterium]